MVLTEWAEAKPLIFRGMFPGIISGDVSHPRPGPSSGLQP